MASWNWNYDFCWHKLWRCELMNNTVSRIACSALANNGIILIAS